LLRCLTGQSGASPDSSVNYSGAPSDFPEGDEFGAEFPGTPDTVRWCTGHCPVAHRTVRCARPGHTSVVFDSLCLNPFLVILLVYCEELILYLPLFLDAIPYLPLTKHVFPTCPEFQILSLLYPFSVTVAAFYHLDMHALSSISLICPCVHFKYEFFYFL
jgi:hypothetical protein